MVLKLNLLPLILNKGLVLQQVGYILEERGAEVTIKFATDPGTPVL